MPKRQRHRRRPPGYHAVAGIDLDEEMRRLCRLPALGGEEGALARRPPELAVRRASKRPRSRVGFAIPAEWRISVTAYPGIRRGDVQETLLHELVHIFIGATAGQRRWHGREFKAVMRRAMREAYGIVGVGVRNAYHGSYAEALERRRATTRTRGRTRLHPGQLALEIESG